MKTQPKEVIYLIGDCDEKRRVAAGDRPGIARARGDEIVSICRMEGRDYYVIGEHPFGGFTVLQYVRYQRSLLDPHPTPASEVRSLLHATGARVPLGRRVSRLGYLERRLVSLAARLTPETRTLIIELDGIPYSRRLRSALRRAAARLRKKYEVWISVTDSRFADRSASVAEYKAGSLISLSASAFRSRPLARRLLIARLRRCFAEPSRPLERGRIIEVSRDNRDRI